MTGSKRSVLAQIVRGPFGLSYRHCLRTCAAPAGVALTAAWLGDTFGEPSQVDDAATAAASPWLTLPLFVVAVITCLAAAHLWPTFSLRRSGADAVRRLERGPLGGRGAVALGAVAAQLCLSIPMTLALCWMLDAPAMARKHHQPQGPAVPILDRPGATLAFALPTQTEIEGIWLRPRASLPTGPGDGQTHLEIASKGQRLATTPVVFRESNQLVRVAIEPQQLEQFELRHSGGNVPLLFGEGHVVAVSPAHFATWQNALLAALLAACTSIVTLTIAGLIGLGTGWATLATTIGTVQFVQWIGGVGPVDEALMWLLRGQWLG